MFTIQGKYNQAKVYADLYEDQVIDQIKSIVNHPTSVGGPIAIMPDTHAGKGSVVGYTQVLGDRVCPNIVGVDIGCFTGDTLIPLVGNGEYKSLKQIYMEKKPVYVYAVTDEQYVVPAKAFAIQTRKNAELVEVLLDNGEKIVCTPDHRFMNRDGSYTEAKDLKSQQSLMPFRMHIDRDGYEVLYQPKLKIRERFNRTVARVVGKFDLSSDVIVHHKDHNKKNNLIENLEVLTWSQHSMLHAKDNTYFNSEEFKKQKQRVYEERGYIYDPKYFDQKQRVGRANLHKYITEHREEFLQHARGVGQRNKAYVIKNNTDHDVKIKQQLGKIKKVLDIILEQGYDISYENYETFRKQYCHNAFTVAKVQSILNKLSMTLEDVMHRSLWDKFVSNNHKVVSVTHLEYCADVYCLNVEKYHNFALQSGVFVHNCGMVVCQLSKDSIIDFDKLDHCIRTSIPNGHGVHDVGFTNSFSEDLINQLHCRKFIGDVSYYHRSLGTLGGGNHFIEIDKDDQGNHYLVIHTGSRHLGVQVCNHYMNINNDAVDYKAQFNNVKRQLIDQLKAANRYEEIEKAIANLTTSWQPKLESVQDVRDPLHFITGDDMNHYLDDIEIVQRWAKANRTKIMTTIVNYMNWTVDDWFESIHNYIDTEHRIIRKGAIAAYQGQRMIVPINMAFGSLICTGKGNIEMNCSAPHGAGRIMSRRKAREMITLEQYQQSMEGIYSTCVDKQTLDEAPMAYKQYSDIAANLRNTAHIDKIIKPVYNFKASD